MLGKGKIKHREHRGSPRKINLCILSVLSVFVLPINVTIPVDLSILLPLKKCESASVGQPLILRPVCIAKLFKFSCFDAGFAWLKFRASPWHFSLFLNGRCIDKEIKKILGQFFVQDFHFWLLVLFLVEILQ